MARYSRGYLRGRWSPLRRTFGSFSSARKGTRGARRNALVFLAAYKAAIPEGAHRPMGVKPKSPAGAVVGGTRLGHQACGPSGPGKLRRSMSGISKTAAGEKIEFSVNICYNQLLSGGIFAMIASVHPYKILKTIWRLVFSWTVQAAYYTWCWWYCFASPPFSPRARRPIRLSTRSA